MAEGLANSLYSDVLKAESAGTKPTYIHPLAIKVMAELGIDISGRRSKNLSEFEGREFDYVVTVCSDADGACPFFPGGGKLIHHGFMDPAGLSGTDEEKTNAFRMIRNEINEWIMNTLVLPSSRD
jgi:arsenate reductase